jgi:hypothetical protein
MQQRSLFLKLLYVLDVLLKLLESYYGILKPHCIRCSHFKVDDISALEASSNRSVRIVEDNVTVSLHQQRTPDPGYGLDAVTT